MSREMSLEMSLEVSPKMPGHVSPGHVAGHGSRRRVVPSRCLEIPSDGSAGYH
jgi:riboflavin synthase alpha subunit